MLSLISKFFLAICIVVGCMSFVQIQAAFVPNPNCTDSTCSGRLVGSCALAGGTPCVKAPAWGGGCGCSEPEGARVVCYCKVW